MEKVAQVVSKLDDAAEFCGKRQDLRFPRVVAIGPQSAGKSSVMERLVSEKFLPTSSGMCTRCPIEITLIATTDEAEGMWVEFDHLLEEGGKLQRFKDFNQVRLEIESRSTALCKKVQNSEKLGVTSQKISMKLFGPNLVNLILVDLPGLVRISTEGQSQDVVQQIENIARDYATDPNTIILAISQANADVATSEALRLAQIVDKTGDRTLAVFTKLDCVKKSKEVTDMLNGRTVKVKLGIIGVKNRSDEPEDTNISMAQLKKNETDFFREKFEEFASRCGIDYLMRKLNSLFVKSMIDYVPKLRKAVKERRGEIESRNRELQREMKNVEKPHMFVMEQVNELVSLFTKELSSGVDSTTSNCGAQLYKIMHEEFLTKLQSLQFPWRTKEGAIATAIANSRGMVPFSFTQQDAFQSMAKEQLGSLRAPLTECIESVKRQIQAAVDRCAKNLRCAQSSPLFAADLREKADAYLSDMFDDVEHQVDLLVCYEEEYTTLSKHLREYNVAVAHVSDHVSRDVGEMQKLLEVHYDETRSQIARMVPKAIVYHIEKARKDDGLKQRLQEEYRNYSEDQLKAKLSGIALLEDEVERVEFELNEVKKYTTLVAELDQELAKIANPDI